ncbi:MAG: hypothetical protein ACREP6_01310 [Candidatus Binataceae bacterium]
MPNRLSQMMRFVARGVECQPEHVQMVMMLYIGAPKSDSESRRRIRALRKASFAKLRPAAEALLDYLGEPVNDRVVEKLTTFALAFCNGCVINYRIDESGAELAANLEHLCAAWPPVARSLASQIDATNHLQNPLLPH